MLLILGSSGISFTIPATGDYHDKTRANLKIQEGCEFFCSYCIVPYARGKARSRQWQDVLREAKEFLANGYQELVLTGVNIACYDDNGRDLADLVESLISLPGSFRIRLGSTEPGPVFHKIIDLMKDNPKLCRFLHLPLQYAEDTILKSMNRRYTVAEFAALANKAIKLIPNLCLGTDIIIGFPGETDDIFQKCLTNLKALPISTMHIFTYSKRPGTPAADFPQQVHGAVALQRHKEVQKLANEKELAFVSANIDEELDIITETFADNCWHGLSDNYILCTISGCPETIKSNGLVKARLTKALGGRMASGNFSL